MISRSNIGNRVATTVSRVFSYPNILTQGRLHCTQHTILCTALQVHT